MLEAVLTVFGYPDEPMGTYPVSAAVGNVRNVRNVRNDGPDLIPPVP